MEITKQALESATWECELREEVIEELEEEKNSKGDLIEALEMKVRDFEAATKHTEKLASENKILKSEISFLNSELKMANKEAKMLKKENVKIENDFLKKSENFESKIRNLMEFKAEKLLEEKDLKSKEKLISKKLKAVEEIKARITIDKIKLDRDLNQNMVNRVVKSSQTDPFINFEKRPRLKPMETLLQ